MWHNECGISNIGFRIISFTDLEPKEYEFYPSLGYYKFHEQKTTWEEAVLICEEERAHLIILNSIQEVHIAQDMFNPYVQDNTTRNNPENYIHVGFHRNQGGDLMTIFCK